MEDKILTNGKPWNQPGVPWKTEAAFWNFVKGVIRKGWSRHPVKIEYLNSKRFKAPLGRITKSNPKGLVWAVNCEGCGNLYRMADVEVDHISPSLEARWYDDIDSFVRRMFYVTFDDIQILCKSHCHPVKTLADARGITLEEAETEKKVIAVNKLPAGKQIAWINEKGRVPGKNKKERDKQVAEILRGEMIEPQE